MSIEKLLREKRREILELASKYGAFNVRIFGSTISGKRRPDSDVDILVTLEPDRSLFDLGGLQFELENLLGVKVDLVSDDSLHWFIKEQVLEEAKAL
ncbi:nucleotidyltransferase family protein [bacterium]|nr:nucleotidyltransferase family protein [bacterium]